MLVSASASAQVTIGPASPLDSAAPTLVEAVEEQRQPVLAFNGDAYLWAWSDRRLSTTNHDVFVSWVQRDGVTAPTAALRVTNFAEDSTEPQIACTSSTCLVTYLGSFNGDGRVLARVMNRDGGWNGEPVPLSTTQFGRRPAAVAASNGSYAVAWPDSATSLAVREYSEPNLGLIRSFTQTGTDINSVSLTYGGNRYGLCLTDRGRGTVTIATFLPGASPIAPQTASLPNTPESCAIIPSPSGFVAIWNEASTSATNAQVQSFSADGIPLNAGTYLNGITYSGAWFDGVTSRVFVTGLGTFTVSRVTAPGMISTEPTQNFIVKGRPFAASTPDGGMLTWQSGYTVMGNVVVSPLSGSTVTNPAGDSPLQTNENQTRPVIVRDGSLFRAAWLEQSGNVRLAAQPLTTTFSPTGVRQTRPRTERIISVSAANVGDSAYFAWGNQDALGGHSIGVTSLSSCGEPPVSFSIDGISNETDPSIASDGQRALVAWVEYGRGASDDIVVAMVDTDAGFTAMTPFVVPGYQSLPAVAYSQGRYLVSFFSDTQDVQAMQFDQAGTLVLPARTLGTTAYAPAVASAASPTQFLTVWSSQSGTGFLNAVRVTLDGGVLDAPPLSLSLPSPPRKPSAVFDGSRFWVAFEQREIDGGANVYAVTLDRTAGFGPLIALATAPENEASPSLTAVGPGCLVLAYSLDNGSSQRVVRRLIENPARECSALPPPVCSTFDAGVDAGVVVDSGVVDAGTVDAGVLDAGIVDAGEVDAGTIDAGVPDASLVIDAGTADDAGLTADGGTTEPLQPRSYLVSCSAVPLNPFVFLLLAAFLRRRTR